MLITVLIFSGMFWNLDENLQKGKATIAGPVGYAAVPLERERGREREREDKKTEGKNKREMKRKGTEKDKKKKKEKFYSCIFLDGSSSHAEVGIA